MSQNQSKTLGDTGWKELYMAAVFESDKSKLAERIIEAHAAIGTRKRKLLKTGDDAQERRLLDTALFSLQALWSCLRSSARDTLRDAVRNHEQPNLA
jgi:hypothetical protein